MITTLDDGTEVHPSALVTVKLCDPMVNPEMVALAPVPVIAPVLMVQLPAGKPDNITLPVATVQVG